jgi:hypothetical protein
MNNTVYFFLLFFLVWDCWTVHETWNKSNIGGNPVILGMMLLDSIQRWNMSYSHLMCYSNNIQLVIAIWHATSTSLLALVQSEVSSHTRIQSLKKTNNSIKNSSIKLLEEYAYLHIVTCKHADFWRITTPYRVGNYSLPDRPRRPILRPGGQK